MVKRIRKFFGSVFFTETNSIQRFAENYQQMLCEKYLSEKFFGSVFPRFRTEHGKIRTRKNSIFGHSYISEIFDIQSTSARITDQKIIENLPLFTEV